MGSEYVHGYADAEQQRLIAQATHWRDDLILNGTTLAPGTRLLEIGCGVGAVLAVLGQAFPDLSLSGVDIEPRQIQAARTHLARLGVQADLQTADALALPYPDASFDHVWMMWFLEHVTEPVAALEEARRVLVPGGVLIAIEVDYNTCWAEPSNPDVVALFGAAATAMAHAGHSDAGTRLPQWLAEAGLQTIDPGKRALRFSGAELSRQVDYAADVFAATLPSLKALAPDTAQLLDAGLQRLRQLPETPGAAIGWTLHKSHARRA